ncbi:MAG: LysM peptidoglycan-binding domain-containing protein [Dictyoglomaceae bacterium]|nr:LysM peptidoglycan-binding domain-containing protein [Dictyoglomaceae bacterium]
MRRFFREFLIYIISFILIVFLANQLFTIEKIPQRVKREEIKREEIKAVQEKLEKIESPSKDVLKKERKEETYTQMIYEVKVGDTTIGIAQRYSIDWRELARINNLKDPNKLYVGQKLIIPIKKD